MQNRIFKDTEKTFQPTRAQMNEVIWIWNTSFKSTQKRVKKSIMIHKVIMFNNEDTVAVGCRILYTFVKFIHTII